MTNEWHLEWKMHQKWLRLLLLQLGEMIELDRNGKSIIMTKERVLDRGKFTRNGVIVYTKNHGKFVVLNIVLGESWHISH